MNLERIPHFAILYFKEDLYFLLLVNDKQKQNPFQFARVNLDKGMTKKMKAVGRGKTFCLSKWRPSKMG